VTREDKILEIVRYIAMNNWTEYCIREEIVDITSDAFGKICRAIRDASHIGVKMHEISEDAADDLYKTMFEDKADKPESS
jgi:hypothetical protein|tara:strand:- start:5974 stop:6213 length:240 start_codon:yes stop_codon:yes gene_type:complete